jgi:hypothetical protein
MLILLFGYWYGGLLKHVLNELLDLVFLHYDVFTSKMF